MFTVRTLGGIAFFLAGTTWLWLTPAFASREVSTSGVAWAVTGVLSLLTLAAFCVGTWGLFARSTWWEPVALAAAALGLLALVPYWIASARAGEPAVTTTWNVFVHVVMVAGVFTLLLVPTLARWVDHHVMAG
jgi:hypothetical protein